MHRRVRAISVHEEDLRGVVVRAKRADVVVLVDRQIKQPLLVLLRFTA